jgi:peptide/nickel transport system substrate-binding protein
MSASSETECRDWLFHQGSLLTQSRLQRLTGWIMPARVTVPAALLALLTNCTNGGPARPFGYLQVDIGTGPASLDPRIATDAISSRIDELIYDPMVELDGNGQPRGDLAEWIERPDSTRLIFHLWHGVRFSTGEQLTARDVVYTYESILDPAGHSTKAAGLRQMQSLTARDDYTVEMRTRGPYAAALEMGTYDIVPYGSALPGPASALGPPGTGPFRPIRFEHDAALVLTRNEYRRYSARAVPGIVFKIVPDATVRALELTEGICDFAENDAVQPDLIPFLAAQPDLRVGQSPGLFFQYLAFNFRDARLRDLRLRRAIALAIDRDAIVHSMLRDTARAATGMLPPENWVYERNVPRYSYNPVEARHLLEAAGYSPDSAQLEFVYKTTPEGRRLAEAIQAMLQRVGIKLDIHTNEWATFYSDLRAGNFDLAAGQISALSPEEYFLFFDSRMVPPFGNDRGAYANPEMDRLLESAEVTLDASRRRAIFSEVQRLAAGDLPYVPLWWIDTVTVMTRRLDGFQPNPNGSLRSLAAASYLPGQVGKN